METFFKYRFSRIGGLILAANHDMHVVLNAEKRTTLGDPSLLRARPIAHVRLRKNRNLGLQSVPVVLRRRVMAQGEDITIPRNDISTRFGGRKDRE